MLSYVIKFSSPISDVSGFYPFCLNCHISGIVCFYYKGILGFDNLPLYAFPLIFPYRSYSKTLAKQQAVGLMPEVEIGPGMASSPFLPDLAPRGHQHHEIRPKTSPPAR
jgi:hypothetical protein